MRNLLTSIIRIAVIFRSALKVTSILKESTTTTNLISSQYQKIVTNNIMTINLIIIVILLLCLFLFLPLNLQMAIIHKSKLFLKFNCFPIVLITIHFNKDSLHLFHQVLRDYLLHKALLFLILNPLKTLLSLLLPNHLALSKINILHTTFSME